MMGNNIFADLLSYKDNYKERVKSLRDSDYLLKRLAYLFSMLSWRSLRSIFKFCFSNPYRSQLYLKYAGSPEVHQLSNYTENNRYPDLFLLLLNHFGVNSNLRILSYGCSTGEEVFTLIKYFPNAEITGVDINQGNIKTCLKNNIDKKIHFYVSNNERWKKEKYDIILCMAVLQNAKNRSPETTNSLNIYPFNKFNSKLKELDAYVKKDGVLVLEYSDYRFIDSDIAIGYEPLQGDKMAERDRPLYNRNNKRIAETTKIHRLFVKSECN
jgi:hypothetical protein